MLLLQLLDLLQGEEGAAAGGWLLGVALRPFLKGVSVAAVHVEPQVLLVLGGEVTELTGKRLSACGTWESGGGDPGRAGRLRGLPGAAGQAVRSPVCLTAMCETRKSSRKVEYLQKLHL